MKYSMQIVFIDAVEDESADDEIDQLFSRLSQIEPPPTLVDDILASIARLPFPPQTPTHPFDGLDEFIVRHDFSLS